MPQLLLQAFFSATMGVFTSGTKIYHHRYWQCNGVSITRQVGRYVAWSIKVVKNMASAVPLNLRVGLQTISIPFVRANWDMGVAQSDVQYNAYYGKAKFKESGPFKELRSIFSVHPEPFTVIARADSGVKSFADLKGKRVNIGNPGSGQRATMEVVMKALGWTEKDFSVVSELEAAEQSKALCDNKIDAMVYVVGHPNGSIKEATTSCDSVLVTVAGPAIEKLIADNPYYRSATIPAGMYRGNEKDTKNIWCGSDFYHVDQDVARNRL